MLILLSEPRRTNVFAAQTMRATALRPAQSAAPRTGVSHVPARPTIMATQEILAAVQDVRKTQIHRLAACGVDNAHAPQGTGGHRNMII
jgi:hypothetical protein